MTEEREEVIDVEDLDDMTEVPKKPKSKFWSSFLEFMVTYGWAMLVVIVCIGALAYFDVLDPDNFNPNTCTCGQCDITFENTTSGLGYNKISCCTQAEWNKEEKKCEYVYQVSKIRALKE